MEPAERDNKTSCVTRVWGGADCRGDAAVGAAGALSLFACLFARRVERKASSGNRPKGRVEWEADAPDCEVMAPWGRRPTEVTNTGIWANAINYIWYPTRSSDT